MKALLLDADGVVLEKGEYFSTHLARVQGIPEEIVTEFFKKEYLSCQRGESDLKEVIEPYLSKWNWSKGVEELLSYWFAHDFSVNEELVKKIQTLRNKDVKCYMASGNEKYRAKYIQDILEEKDMLDGYFFSCNIGATKKEVKFFEEIINSLDITAEDVCFVDNEDEVLEVARSVGIESFKFFDDVIDSLIARV